MFTNNIMKVYGELNVVSSMSSGANPQNTDAIWKAFENNVNENWDKWLGNAGLK